MNMLNQKSNWVSRLVNFKSHYRVNFTKSLKSASGISRVIALFSAAFVLGIAYKLIFQLNEATSFNLPLSGMDIMPLHHLDRTLFYSLTSIEMGYGIIIVLGFWNLDRFLKSIDAENPFANSKSKIYIGRVATMAQVYFVAKFVFKLVLMQAPDAFTQQLLTDRTSFTIFDNTGLLFPFNYLILAYFVSIFSQLFKRGIAMNEELEEVI